ncbi:MAG: ATP-binding protein [Bacteroidota bacterium]|jgi:predicted AAA+ superfamily ATPase
MEALFERSNQLIAQVDTAFTRYAYPRINWNNRLIGLIGARGVGKTTLILQHIKKHLSPKDTLYATAEDFYFAKNRLTDLASEWVKAGGKYLFLDEIHKYADWSRALKLIYDYHPELQVVFTGSSILDIKKGSSDLSRRAVVYAMQGLSFREYLKLFHAIEVPVYSLNEIIEQAVDVPQLPHPLPLFRAYLKTGYYPFAREDDFGQRLQQVVNQTLEVDIPSFAGMHVSTARKLKQLLAIVAQSVPFKPNMSKLAESMNISRNNVADYLHFMEEAGLVAQLRSQTEGIRAMGKVDKVYLDNTNLAYNLAGENQNKGNVRETFFLNQLKLDQQVRPSMLGDFRVDELEFEVGGKDKGIKQIKTAQKGYLVKDDIEKGYLNTIPLWHFGLMY